MSNEPGFPTMSVSALLMGSSLLGGQQSVCNSQAATAARTWWEPLSVGVCSVYCGSLLYQAHEMYMDKCLVCRSEGPEHDGQKSEELQRQEMKVL